MKNSYIIKAIYLFVIITFIFITFISGEKLHINQIKNETTEMFRPQNVQSLSSIYESKNINKPKQQIYLSVFKEEKELELWTKGYSSDIFTLFKKYPICAPTIKLGPKRKQGDNQTPEGFYIINKFNPLNSTDLSIGINYPNTSDSILGNQNPGGDIFIHGCCETIGCLPLADDLIKEVYLIAIEAKNNGQVKIPVHIFPFRMTEEKINQVKEQKRYCALIPFWNNLKPGYDYFEKNKNLPEVNIARDGKYTFN